MTLIVPMIGPEGDEERGGLFAVSTTTGRVAVLFRTEEGMATFARLLAPRIAPGMRLFALGTSADRIEDVAGAFTDAASADIEFIRDDDARYAELVVALTA
jgi:hypothetical protein